MAPQPEKSQLKRALQSAGEQDTEYKKPRTEQVAADKGPETPLKVHNAAFPSPITQGGSTTTDVSKEGTATPPPRSTDDASQVASKGPVETSQRNGLSSPPSDTQPYSQFLYPPGPWYEVQDEEAEGVWGYLVPMDDKFGDVLVLRKRSACPLPNPPPLPSGKAVMRRGSLEKQEEKYEEKKQHDGIPAGGYLIGRHPECDRVIKSSLAVSNRHCLLFLEHKGGGAVAVLEDLSANGTFVNDAIVGRNKRRELHEGDQIHIVDEAKCMFRYPRSQRATNGFSEQYSVQEQLGKGHFASVYLCIEKSSGMRFAVKKFEKRGGPSERSRVEGLQQEIAVLMSVSHPSLLCLKDTFDEADGVYLVLELAPEGELFNWIVMKQKLSEEETRKVFVQLFQGVKYLHERNIVHRDIKPENILLVDKNLNIKLADFGLAKIIGEESFTTTLCGTPSYVAPEILESSNHRRYTRAVDVWSLGVVLYICLCGFPPFSDELYNQENPYTLSQQIKLGRFDYPSPYWDSVGDPALDLIDKMLTVDVNKRITIDECLEHPWTRNACGPSASIDSTDGLTGALGNLDFAKRKVQRERTLLSSINDVKVSKVVELASDAPPLKIYEKNGSGSRIKSPAKASKAKKANKEDTPSENRNAEEFMEMGGKGDETLFGNDETSKYPGA
ncbi:putative serine threonine-protein kinase chk2 protein [Lasiodiplodia theobromae]|uniref:Putative serine/threonine-protein kinase fhkC n=1 Tax=Lasiodiplodia theobromae TaxID=45133 RepID=A0A5N5DLA7_9PEZI|nr:Serine threonine protein kinase [Lasiodiplodia theobromae]KAB2578527.1 putative serine/threonine-protein kinase fhkC [Lasiodiplodia theobromae]KAF4538509.1 Serine threonine protein kinase [Lasiodiplodia theobromae]KAF9640639.1 putative serine threonine-protein kinase chk2 protein [Lasiodiplodia theobromae]